MRVRTTGCSPGPRAAPGQTCPDPCPDESGLPLAGDFAQSVGPPEAREQTDPRGCPWRPVAQCTPHCTAQDIGSSSKADVSSASPRLRSAGL